MMITTVLVLRAIEEGHGVEVRNVQEPLHPLGEVSGSRLTNQYDVWHLAAHAGPSLSSLAWPGCAPTHLRDWNTRGYSISCSSPWVASGGTGILADHLVMVASSS